MGGKFVKNDSEFFLGVKPSELPGCLETSLPMALTHFFPHLGDALHLVSL